MAGNRPVNGVSASKQENGTILKIADLVDDDPTKRSRVQLRFDHRPESDRDYVDIMLPWMAKEGFDRYGANMHLQLDTVPARNRSNW